MFHSDTLIENAKNKQNETTEWTYECDSRVSCQMNERIEL